MQESLLSPLSTPKMVSLQFSSRCNLRCIYCPQHDGQYEGVPMTQEFADSVVSYVCENDTIENVSVGFFGETLCYKGWESHVETLLDAGKKMDICSNFQHTLTEKQIDVLSRFSSIQFSIDTVDMKLLNEIRPPADIRQIVHNMHLIRGYAIQAGRTIPQMSWNCTLTNRVAPHLMVLAGYAASCCVPMLNFNELVYYDKADPSLRSVFDLDDEAFLAVCETIANVRKLATEYEMQIRFAVDHWLDQLELKKERVEKSLNSRAQGGEPVTQSTASIQGVGGYSKELGREELQPGQTRLCLEPWRNLYVMPTGDIYTCCTRGESMGVVSGKEDVRDVRMNERYADLRQQLLSGNLTDDVCKGCSLKPITTPETLQKAVAQLLDGE